MSRFAKKFVMASTAALALCAHSFAATAVSRTTITATRHPPITVLYDQNNNTKPGVAAESENFTTGDMDAYDNSGADDFIVPAGQVWHVTQVDVSGLENNVPPTSETVIFYRNARSHPGRVKYSVTLNCADSSGNFSCTIPGPRGNGVKLSGGKNGRHYWLAVVANCDYDAGCTDWLWYLNSVTHNLPGKWENPGGARNPNCITWKNTSHCWGENTDDYAFDLQGF